MTQSFLALETHDHATVLTMTRWSKRNALHGPMWEALRRGAEAAGKSGARALILTGSEGHFSAGMDLSMDNPLFAQLGPAAATKDVAALKALIQRLNDTMNAFVSLPCPTIAAIDGACAGSGLELALACDMRVASKDAFFSLPEALVGLVPDVGGTVRLTRLIGTARATDLILTGRRITAEKALAWGLVDRLVDGPAIDGANKLAKAMTASAPIAAAQVLSVIRATPGLSTQEAAAAEAQAGLNTLLAGEFIEGVTAFIQKREPNWRTKP